MYVDDWGILVDDFVGACPGCFDFHVLVGRGDDDGGECILHGRGGFFTFSSFNLPHNPAGHYIVTAP